MDLELNFDGVDALISKKEAEEKIKLGTILVVDDEEINVSSLTQILKHKFNIVSSTDPREALGGEWPRKTSHRLPVERIVGLKTECGL